MASQPSTTTSAGPRSQCTHQDQVCWLGALPPGHQGTIRTLEVMAWLCRRDYRSSFVTDFINRLLKDSLLVKAESNKKIRSVFGHGSEKAHALFLFARDQIRFIEDRGPNGEENVERIADFQRTAELGWGDCDDKIIWLCTALLNQDISCRFRVQSYQGDSWNHVYCDYWDWTQWAWVPLDPTADGHQGTPIAEPGWKQPLGFYSQEMIYPV